MTRRIAMAGTLGLSGLALAGCNVAPPENGFFHALRMGWPMGNTRQAGQMGSYWVWVWVGAWILGILVCALMSFVMGRCYSKARSRRGGNEEFPRQTGYSVPLELVLTTVPVL